MKVEWKKLVGKRVLVSYRLLWKGVSGCHQHHQILSVDSILHPWVSSDSGIHLLDPFHRAPSHGTSQTTFRMRTYKVFSITLDNIRQQVYQKCKLYPGIFEVKVLEVSPSGKFVKLEHCDDGMTEWRSVGTIRLVEILD